MDKGKQKLDNNLVVVQPKCPRCLPGPLPGKKGIGMTLKKENWEANIKRVKKLNVSWNYSWGTCVKIATYALSTEATLISH
jgi:hypothetical protein